MHKRQSFKSMFLSLFVATCYLFLYVPILILILFSFNSVSFPYQWKSFSLSWYQELFSSLEIWQATKNSLIVASASVFFSLTFGLLSVVWITKKKMDATVNLFYGNVLVPEIVFAVGLLSFFVALSVPMGLAALTVAHTVLGFGYVIPFLYTRFNALDKRMIEASLDLGATYTQTFFKVILPLLAPSLIAAAILVFILSLDDFLLAFFCGGTATQTLSTYIFSMIRSGVSPVVNALATVMLVVSSCAVALFCSLQSQGGRDDKKLE